MTCCSIQLPEVSRSEIRMTSQPSVATVKSPTAEASQPSAPQLNKNWRYYTGMTALVLAAIAPLFSFAAPLLGLPTAWAVTVAAGCIAGGPEVLLLAAAALLGKETVHYFTAAAKNWLVSLFSQKENATTTTPEAPTWHCPSGFALVMETDRRQVQTVAHGRWC